MHWAVLIFCAVFVAGTSACGGDSGEPPAAAQRDFGTCAPLVDEVFSAYQDRIDAFADRELGDLLLEDFSSQRDELTQRQRELDKRAKELRCNPKDLLLIVADRGDELEAETPAAAAVAKAQFLSAVANALFYAPDQTAGYVEQTFTPQPVDSESDVSIADAEAIDFGELQTCAELVDAQLTLLQVALNDIDRTPFGEYMRGETSSSLSGEAAGQLQRALDGSDCSAREFSFEFLQRAETLEAVGAFANLAKAASIEEQWNRVSDDSEFSISVSVTATKQVVAPGERVQLNVTIENDGSQPVHRATLRETDQFGSSDATAVGLPPLAAGELMPGEKNRFTVTFHVPDDAKESITVEYDSAKGEGEGGSAFSSSGTGINLLVED